MSENKQSCENLALRVLWMALFVLVWRVAELVLLAVVVVQLIYRLFKGRPHLDVMNFGDSLSQYLAQIGRFGSFHSDEKPWPFADWPTPREPQGECVIVVTPADVRMPEPEAPRDESAVAEASSAPRSQSAPATPADVDVQPAGEVSPEVAQPPQVEPRPETGPDDILPTEPTEPTEPTKPTEPTEPKEPKA